MIVHCIDHGRALCGVKLSPYLRLLRLFPFLELVEDPKGNLICSECHEKAKEIVGV